MGNYNYHLNLINVFFKSMERVISKIKNKIVLEVPKVLTPDVVKELIKEKWEKINIYFRRRTISNSDT